MGFYDSYKVGELDEQVELDLTNSHLHSLESVEVKSSLEVSSALLPLSGHSLKHEADEEV